MTDELYRPSPYSYNQWHKDQIYKGTDTANGIVSGGVVPNVNDTVVSWTNNIKVEERVVAVDPTTNLSTLELVEYPVNGNDAMIGVPVGVGNLANVAVLLFNPLDSTLPATISNQLPIYGNDLKYFRLFLGNDISNLGQIISVRYDSNGNILDNKGLLSQADLENNNVRRYITNPCNLTVNLAEDTLVTAVFYGDNDGEVMYQELVVKHNNVIANVHNEPLYISRVYLESSYLSPVNDKEVLIPHNLLNNSFTPRIFKEFQTGRREELFESSSNVTLVGWGDHINGTVGEKFPLVLTYLLAPGEMSPNVDKITGTHISEHYDAIVIDIDNELELKLFVLPYYDTGYQGFKLKFYLYNGLRNKVEEVTSKVTVSNFDGKVINLQQTITFSLPLATYPQYPMTSVSDTIDLYLYGQPGTVATPYTLWYHRDLTRPYGNELRAKIETHYGSNTLNLTNGFSSYDDWLENLYYRTSPLYDGTIEIEAPRPDYVDVTIGGTTITIDTINYWNGAVQWTGSLPATGTEAILKWYNKDVNNKRIELAIGNIFVEVV